MRLFVLVEPVAQRSQINIRNGLKMLWLEKSLEPGKKLQMELKSIMRTD